MADNNNNAEAVLVRLDETARNEAQSVLFHAYREEPTFQYLFDHRKPGYSQRVRATIRELIDLYLELNQDAIGVMVDETLVAVAFVGEPELRLNLADQLGWRGAYGSDGGLFIYAPVSGVSSQDSRPFAAEAGASVAVDGSQPKIPAQGVWSDVAAGSGAPV